MVPVDSGKKNVVTSIHYNQTAFAEITIPDTETMDRIEAMSIFATAPRRRQRMTELHATPESKHH
jgi:hypothetical protein